MTQEKLDFKYVDKTIHDLESVSRQGLFAFIPDSYDESIKNDIRVVFTKYIAGLKSFDYTEKRYFDPNPLIPEEQPYTALLKNITQSIWGIVSEIYNSFNRLNLKEESAISLGLVSTFSRLTNSYEASLFLLKNQYFFESISLNRMIFEQLNYCFKLTFLSNEDFKTLSKKQIRHRLNPTDINKLKDFLPQAEIGRFYSFLSEIAHIDYKQIGRYLTDDEANEGYAVIMKSIIQSIESALVLLKLVDINFLVYEYSFKDISDLDIKYLQINSSEISFNPERQTKKLIIKYSKEFEKLKESIELPTKYNKRRINKEDEDLPF